MKKKVKFLIIFSLLTGLLLASQVKFWQKEKPEDFLKGKLIGVSMTYEGVLLPAPVRKKLPVIKEEFIFDVAAKGQREIYVATGHEGKLYMVDLTKNTAKLIYDAPEMDVFTVTVSDKGDVYFATSPKGKVYKYSKGKIKTFFDPDEKFIWRIKWHKGYLWVATGKNASFYKVNPSGEAEKIFEVEDAHIMNFTFSGDSIILVTARKGRLYIYTNKKLRLLWESPWEEITGLALYKNRIFVGGGYKLEVTVPKKEKKEKETTPKGSVTVEVTYLTSPDMVKTLKPPVAQIPKGATLYAVDFSGNAEKVWTCPEAYISSIASYRNKLYIATGKKARIYTYEGKEKVKLLFEEEAEEIRFLYPAAKLFFATAVPSSAYYLTGATLEKGEYLSEVLDTKSQSKWGRVFFEGSLVKVYTRTGNSSKPDKTWSSWAPPISRTGEKVYSPFARFIQFKIEIASGGKLENLKISYLPKNKPPVIKEIKIHPPHVVYKSYSDSQIKGLPSEVKNNSKEQKKYIVTVVGKQEERKGFQTVSWQAYDPDGDKLLFDVYILDLKNRKEVLIEKNWSDNYYVFDTTFFPDGKYAVKIVAKDELSNQKKDALKTEFISRSFYIDNTPPQIKILERVPEGSAVRLKIEVVDNQSYIKELRYSTDAKTWHLVMPEDGLADSKKEIYILKVSAGSRITLRATDALKNTKTFPVQ